MKVKLGHSGGRWVLFSYTSPVALGIMFILDNSVARDLLPRTTFSVKTENDVLNVMWQTEFVPHRRSANVGFKKRPTTTAFP